jgi:hypothetical protein
MTDTETTLAGEVAAVVAVFRDIAQAVDGIVDALAAIRDLLDSAWANGGGANAPGLAHASTPGDYGTQQNPRATVQLPRGEAFTPAPPTRTGDTVDPPQNATQCVWPAEPGWYWVRGVDSNSMSPSVEGFARLSEAGHFNGVDRDSQDWSIYRGVDGDRLDSAVRVTPVPTELIEELRAARNWRGGLTEAVDAILSWIDQHEEAQG